MRTKKKEKKLKDSIEKINIREDKFKEFMIKWSERNEFFRQQMKGRVVVTGLKTDVIAVDEAESVMKRIKKSIFDEIHKIFLNIEIDKCAVCGSDLHIPSLFPKGFPVSHKICCFCLRVLEYSVRGYTLRSTDFDRFEMYRGKFEKLFKLKCD